MFHLHEVTSISQSTARSCGLFFFAAIGGGHRGVHHVALEQIG